MPRYDYRCRECNNIFEKTLPMKDYDLPEKEPCPTCGAKKVEQIVQVAPNMAVDSTVDVTRPKGQFRDIMTRIAETAPGIAGSKRERALKNKYNL